MHNQEAKARAICATLREAGFRALFAGGCVRDRIRGTAPKDYDIATNALPPEVAEVFPRTIAVGASFGVVIVVDDGEHFEVATFRKDGPYLDGRRPSRVDFVDEEEDARRRDFTINALFYDPDTEEVLDYVGGQEDLRRGVLRCVGEPAARFTEDYLRLLRAVRFSARLNFGLAPDTRAAMVDGAPNILKTSPERIREELTKMLTEGYAHRSLTLLDETGLLKVVLPEIDAMKGVEQPPNFHPEGDVFVHTMLLMKHLEGPCSATLAFGALLHDVGKPATQTFEDRIRFNCHAKVGADMARCICRRLRFSNDDTDRIVWLVAQHMRLAAIPEMRESKRKRFVREEGFDELLALCRLDCLASIGTLDTIEWIQAYRANVPEETMRPAPLITGDDLIAMGYTPGPKFKELLRAVEDAQLEGRIATKEEALALAMNSVGKADVADDQAHDSTN
ncbi:MAG: CCA tRNA nucleotidyltransferase [Candidatus Hydrogenedentes bacterium]|nr:CCA tRNA nucleotidyltransferase [Candidatus Hydrogenedentota bacterium]